ncbi:MAG: hypothetical protein IT380_04095 [Myxococcales bacterium]|nr:hypothetical protein [Myxococcales bacterium]
MAPGCEGAAFCDVGGCAAGEGVCRPLRGAGEACASSAECAWGDCTQGRCQRSCNALERLGCAGGNRDWYGYFLFFSGTVLLRRRRAGPRRQLRTPPE